jgi:hypothetical protein
MPELSKLRDEQLTMLLDNFDAREVLHVTFGSVLHNSEFRESFFTVLRENEDVYYEMLATHFGRHFAPFGETSVATTND